jgi:hypothetical protein
MKTILKRFSRAASVMAPIDPEVAFQLKMAENPLSVTASDIFVRNMRRAQTEGDGSAFTPQADPELTPKQSGVQAMGQRVEGADVRPFASYHNATVYRLPNGTVKKGDQLIKGKELLGKVEGGKTIVLTESGRRSLERAPYDYQSENPFYVDDKLIYGVSPEPGAPSKLSYVDPKSIANDVRPVFYASVDGGPDHKVDFRSVDDATSKKAAQEVTDVKSFVVRDRNGNVAPMTGKAGKDGHMPIALYRVYEGEDGELFNEPGEGRHEKYIVPSASISANQVINSFGGIHTVRSYYEDQAEKGEIDPSQVEPMIEKYMRGKKGNPDKMPMRIGGKTVLQVDENGQYVNPLLRTFAKLRDEHMVSSDVPTDFEHAKGQGDSSSYGDTASSRLQWRPTGEVGEKVKAQVMKWFEQKAAERLAPGVPGATVTPVRGDSFQDPFAIINHHFNTYYAKPDDQYDPKFKPFNLESVHPRPDLQDFLDEYDDPRDAQRAYDQAASEWKKNVQQDNRGLKKNDMPLPREVDRLHRVEAKINSALQGIDDQYAPKIDLLKVAQENNIPGAYARYQSDLTKYNEAKKTDPAAKAPQMPIALRRAYTKAFDEARNDTLQPLHAIRGEDPGAVDARRQQLAQVLPPDVMHNLERGQPVSLSSLNPDIRQQVESLKGQVPLTSADYQRQAVTNLLEQRPDADQPSTVADDIIRIVKSNPKLRMSLVNQYKRSNPMGVVDQDMINDGVQAGLVGAFRGYNRRRPSQIVQPKVDSAGQPIPMLDASGNPKLNDGNPMYHNETLTNSEGEPMMDAGGDYDFDDTSLIDALCDRAPVPGRNVMPLTAVLNRAAKFGTRYVQSRGQAPKESELDAPIGDDFSLGDLVDSPKDEQAYNNVDSFMSTRPQHIQEEMKNKEYQLDEIDEAIENLQNDPTVDEDERDDLYQDLVRRKMVIKRDIKKLHQSLVSGDYWTDENALPDWAASSLVDKQTLPDLQGRADNATKQHMLSEKVDEGFASSMPTRLERAQKIIRGIKGQVEWLDNEVQKLQGVQDTLDSGQTVRRLKPMQEALKRVLVTGVRGRPLVGDPKNVGASQGAQGLVDALQASAQSFKDISRQLRELEAQSPGAPSPTNFDDPKNVLLADLKEAAEKFNMYDQQIQSLARIAGPVMVQIHDEMQNAGLRSRRFEGEQQQWVQRNLQKGSQTSNLIGAADHYATIRGKLDDELTTTNEAIKNASLAGVSPEHLEKLKQKAMILKERMRSLKPQLPPDFNSYNVNTMRTINGGELYAPIVRAFADSGVKPTPQNVSMLLSMLGFEKSTKSNNSVPAISNAQREALISSVVAGNPIELQRAIDREPEQIDDYKQQLKEQAGEAAGIRQEGYRDQQSMGVYEDKALSNFEDQGDLGNALRTYTSVANYPLPINNSKIDFNSLVQVANTLSNPKAKPQINEKFITDLAQYISVAASQYATRMKYDEELQERNFVGQESSSVRKVQMASTRLFSQYIDLFFRRYAHFKPVESQVRTKIATLTGQDASTINEAAIQARMLRENKSREVAIKGLTGAKLSNFINNWELSEATLQTTSAIAKLYPGTDVTALTPEQMHQVSHYVAEHRAQSPMRVKGMTYSIESKILEPLKEGKGVSESGDARSGVQSKPKSMSEEELIKHRAGEIQRSDLPDDQKLAEIEKLKKEARQLFNRGAASVVEAMLARMRHVILQDRSAKGGTAPVAGQPGPYDQLAGMMPANSGWAPTVVHNPEHLGFEVPEDYAHMGAMMGGRPYQRRNRAPVAPAVAPAPVAYPGAPEPPDDDDNLLASTLVKHLYRTASRFDAQGEFDLADRVDMVIAEIVRDQLKANAKG